MTTATIRRADGTEVEEGTVMDYSALQVENRELKARLASVEEELAEVKGSAEWPQTEGPPDELWLQWYGDDDGDYLILHDALVADVTFSTTKVFPRDVRYVRAEAGADGGGVGKLVAAKNLAYAERNRLLAVLSKCYRAHTCRHEGPECEEEWRTVVCIHFPTGQATWHIHDNEVWLFDHLPAGENQLFDHLPAGENHWDGHTKREKYERLAEL